MTNPIDQAAANEWARLYALLQKAEKDVAFEVKRMLEVARQRGTAEGIVYRSSRSRALQAIKAKISALEKGMARNSVAAQLEKAQAKLAWRLTGGKAGMVDAFQGYIGDNASQRILANVDLNMGKLLEQNIEALNGTYASKVGQGLKAAELQIKSGLLTGKGVEEVARKISTSIIGAPARSGAKALAYQTKRLVYTEMSNASYDLSLGFGRSERRIKAVKIQRGPGPCPGNACGMVLGVAEGGIATFPVGDAPSLQVHPNGQADIVGYIFETDTRALQGANQHAAKMQKSSPMYRAYKDGREQGYEALAKVQKTERYKAASRAYNKKERRKAA